MFTVPQNVSNNNNNNNNVWNDVYEYVMFVVYGNMNHF